MGRCRREYFYEVGGACGGMVVDDVAMIRLRDEAGISLCEEKEVQGV